jgi:hypothetical protein
MKCIRIIHLRLVLLILLLLNIDLVVAQWQPHSSPSQSEINVTGFFENSGTYYSVTNCGIYYKNSTNDPWQLYSDLLVSYCYINKDTLYASHKYEYDGLSYNLFYFDLKKQDPIPVSIGYDSDTKALLLSQNRLLVGDGNTGFKYRSGNEWTTVNDGLPKDSVYNWEGGGYYYYHRVYDLIEFESSIYAATQRGVFKSEVSNFQWQPTGLPNENISKIKIYNDTLYAMTENKVYYSPDNGNTWHFCYQVGSVITDFHVYNNKYYLSTKGNGTQGIGILVSENLNDWYPYNTGLADLYINFIGNDEKGLICGSEFSGFYNLIDGSWHNNNSGFINSSLNEIAATSNGVLCSDSWNTKRVWYASDGLAFTDITPEITDLRYFGKIISVDDTIVLSYSANIEPWYERNRFLIISTDNGETWQQPANQPPQWGDDTYRLVPGSSGFYVYENDMIYYTDNFGDTWKDMSVPSAFCNNVNSIVEMSGIPYMSACADAEVLKWVNNEWELSNVGLPDDEVKYLFASDSNLYAYTYNQTFVTDEYAETWNYAADVVPDASFILDSKSYEQSVIVTTPVGIFYIEDDGNSWVDLNSGLPARKVRSLDIFNDTLLVTTKRNGIWKKAVSDLHLSVNNNCNSKGNLLVYPNPATNYFTVNSDMVNTKYLNLEMFDSFGRKIKSATIPSYQEKIVVNTVGLSQGAYIVKVSNGNGDIRIGKILVK